MKTSLSCKTRMHGQVLFAVLAIHIVIDQPSGDVGNERQTTDAVNTDRPRRLLWGVLD